MSQLFYSPLSTLNHLHRDFGHIAANPLSSTRQETFSPAIDIRESEQAYSVLVDVPGLEPDAIDVSLHQNLLTIKGNREAETPTGDNSFRRRERASGAFSRQFSLPDSTDNEAISAKTHNGVLEIRIPKAVTPGPLKITVNG
ncbi:MAG: Hsp20/alpha crystallin family protein [Pseudomonadales bacterium]|nr:Hsp20/alpha crystallin family protein [Pseudomonadales bacterium]